MNQRQYLLISGIAYAGTKVTPEFVSCFGQVYEPMDGDTEEATPIAEPTLQQYIEGLNSPGGTVRQVDAGGTPMVLIPIPWDLVKAASPAQAYAKITAAKRSIDPIFEAEGTDWGARWLGDFEARQFIAMNENGGAQ